MKKTGFYIAIGLICGLLLMMIVFDHGGLEQAGKVAVAVSVLITLFFMLRRSSERAVQGRRNFDRIAAAPCTTSITFDDVAANSEARSSLQELADYLKDPDKYLKMGARMPRGILLYGPPGTGKTLLARALAGEAGVPFFSLSGSDFVQMYVGVGAGRVRDLFSKARKAGKCVIFIDEIDAMGKRRDQSSSDERDQTLNALLSEMSGFKDSDGIMVLAATNRLDMLDPALTRPGRFDRHIEVGLPGREERLDILKLHARNKPLASDVDLQLLAGNTIQFSGASLESLMNEAAIRAVKRGSDQIEQQDIDKAYISVIAGEDRPVTASREELAVIALHEAGHAIASLCLLPENHLERISILPSGKGAAGYNLSIPLERMLLTKEHLCAQIQVLLAGRAAEMLVNQGTITSGASNDLTRASEIAAAMVMDLGMTDEAAVSLRALQKGCSVGAQDAMSQARKLLQEQLEQVSELLTEHTNDLMLLTEALLTNESLNHEELCAILPGLAPSETV